MNINNLPSSSSFQPAAPLARAQSGPQVISSALFSIQSVGSEYISAPQSQVRASERAATVGEVAQRGSIAKAEPSQSKLVLF